MFQIFKSLLNRLQLRNYERIMIEDDESLLDLCHVLKNTDFIGLDTEFERRKTFFAELSLITLVCHRQIFLIDAIAIIDLTPLYKALEESSAVKVLHACREDLEIFSHHGKIKLNPIFDTQIAAAFIGLPLAMSYENLVKKVLHIDCEQHVSHTRWLKRPLSKDLIDYAMGDVLYLPLLYKQLIIKLRLLGRIGWAQAEMDSQIEQNLQSLYNNNYYPKLKGKRYLTSAQKSAAFALCSWREQMMRKLNKPRKYIARDELLITVAKLDLEQLKNDDENTIFPPKLLAHKTEIMELLEKTQDEPFFEENNHHPPNPQAFTLLNKHIDSVAARSKMPANLILKKKLRKEVCDYLLRNDYESIKKILHPDQYELLNLTQLDIKNKHK